MTFGQVDQREKEQLTEALLRYCELDTLAMVEIYRKLDDLSKWFFYVNKITGSARIECFYNNMQNFPWVYHKWLITYTSVYLNSQYINH